MASENVNGLWASRPILVTVRRGSEVIVQRRLDQPFVRVGDHPAADVVLHNSAAGHCPIYLHSTDEGIYCLGLAPRTPNGWMQAKNYAHLGGYQIYAAFADDGPHSLSLPDDLRKKSESGAWPQIEIRGRHGGKSRRPLPRQLTVVGSGKPSSLRLDDETVCDVHCALYWDGRRMWVIDLVSKNGTLLDGRRVHASLLTAGHDLLIGNNRLCWRMAPSPSADETLVAELRARLAASERQRGTLEQALLQKADPCEVPVMPTRVERSDSAETPQTGDKLAAGLLGDELVERLLDFQAKRQGAVRRRQMIWTAAAALLVLTAGLVASAVLR